MRQAFDSVGRRLVYLGEPPSSDFWARQWSPEDFEQALARSVTGDWVVKITRRFLQPGSRVLEAGCGRGDKVNALVRSGYEATGIDFSESLVRKINRLKPELDTVHGDVRELPFDDESFDGYWSLGVIEHFLGGYVRILKEAHRVLKPGGFCFLAAPTMSPLRLVKTRLSRYPDVSLRCIDRGEFFQFALHPHNVLKRSRRVGFECLESRLYDPMTGLKQETGPATPFFKWLDESRSLPARVGRRVCTAALSRAAGHGRLFILRKV